MSIPKLPSGAILPLFEWAIQENDEFGNPNKIEPPPENQQTGLVIGQPWPRTWLNYSTNNFSRYLQHLVNDPVGTIKIMKQGIITDPTDQWGGTWVKTTDTIGGINSDVFEKTVL